MKIWYTISVLTKNPWRIIFSVEIFSVPAETLVMKLFIFCIKLVSLYPFSLHALNFSQIITKVFDAGEFIENSQTL